MAVYNMSKPRMGVTLSFATDYMQMTTIAQGLRLGNLKGLGFLFSFSKAGSLNIGSLMSLHPMQCLLPDLDFAGITAITISIPVSIAVLSCAFNIISLSARHVFKRRSERKSQGQTSAFPWVMFKRHCVHSAICSGQLMFAPLFQHSLTLFHFSKIGGEKRLWVSETASAIAYYFHVSHSMFTLRPFRTLPLTTLSVQRGCQQQLAGWSSQPLFQCVSQRF